MKLVGFTGLEEIQKPLKKNPAHKISLQTAWQYIHYPCLHILVSNFYGHKKDVVYNLPHLSFQGIHVAILMSEPHFWSNITSVGF